MADLIGRTTAIKLLRGEAVAKYPNSFCLGLFAAADEVNKLPAVDAVEVVRCKDCRRYSRDEMFGGGYCDGVKKKLNDFCSYGERREDDV